MRLEERFVLDTNVVVSALCFPRSKPRLAFDLAFDAGTILASRDTLNELLHVLRRPKLAAYVTLSEREAFLHAFSQEIELVEPNERITICRDPRDNQFLELSAAGRADYLITGDGDLLTLGSFRATAIMAPAVFLKQTTED